MAEIWREEISLLPEHMQLGVMSYIEDGIPPGGFLEAVFANDFLRACQVSDASNRHRLYKWGAFILGCPDNCHGSYPSVEAWIKCGGLNGLAKEIERV